MGHHAGAGRPLAQATLARIAGWVIVGKHSVKLPSAILVHVLTSVFGVSQTQVQRYLSLPSLARATTAVYLNLLLTTVMLALVGWLGRLHHNGLTLGSAAAIYYGLFRFGFTAIRKGLARGPLRPKRLKWL